jgi:Domain of unknown function (DUF4314)
MKGQLNPELKVGDKIMCFHMEGETGVPPGTLGVVTRITRDPFESENDSLISVKWDNGSNLALITSTDAWKLSPKESIEEQSGSPEYDYFSKNPDVFENFDYKFFKKYLLKLRESGVVNMFQASPFLYSGEEWIDRYHGEHQEDNEAFQEVLEMAEESKNKMIQGLLKYMESKKMDIDDMSKVNSLINRFAMKINQFYMTFV